MDLLLAYEYLELLDKWWFINIYSVDKYDNNYTLALHVCQTIKISYK